MTGSLLTGKLVRLAASDPEEIAPLMARWANDSEYVRLQDDDPCQLPSIRQWQEWAINPNPSGEFFVIRELASDRIIGFLGLGMRKWIHAETYVGIGLGEREYWGRGYGTEAMRLALQYAFQELNLHRVSLSVIAYNERAIRSYEKAGFRSEGRLRQTIRRAGRRWDEVCMSILRREWEALQAEPAQKQESE